MTIYFRQPQQPSVAITLAPHRWGSNGHLIVASADHQVWFSLSGNIADLIIELQEATKKLEKMVCTRAELEYITETNQKPITNNDLKKKSTTEQLELLIQRFSEIDTIDPDLSLLSALKSDYRTLTGRSYTPHNGGQSQLDIDLELVEQAEFTPFNENGKPIKGIQTRIAEALSISNGGQTNRKRILAVLNELKTSKE